jgi:phage protein D
MARTPDFRVVVGGQDISSYLVDLLERGKLMTVEVTDNSGKEADSIQIDVVRDGTIPIPAKRTLIECEFGWLETGRRDYGMFYSDQPQTSGSGSGDEGHKLSISGTSADMSGTLKQQRTQSYDKKTVGEIVKEVAGRNKLIADQGGHFWTPITPR